MTNAENVLYEFLVESNFMSNSEFDLLTESSKIESIKELTKEVLNNVLARLSTVDTTLIDRSRGDIRQFSGLEIVQEAVKSLISTCRKYDLGINKIMVPQTVFTSLEEIVLAMKNLSAKSNNFKEAYRNKKTLLMLQYQSIITAIISELSYIISSVIEIKNNEIEIRSKIDYIPTKYYDALKAFNHSITTGEFDKIFSDVKLVREFFSELSPEYMNTILEAGDIMSMIVDGVKGFYNSFDNSGRLTGLIYKAAGVITLILSLREVFYTLYRCNNKLADSINNIKNFVNFKFLPNNNTINKFITYNNKNRKDVAEATSTATREIKRENEDIATEIKSIPATPVLVNNSSTETKSEPVIKSDDDFTLDF